MKRSTRVFAGSAPRSSSPGVQAWLRREDAAEAPDSVISGDGLERVGAIALAVVGGGRVTSSDVGDEESYYEVEVILDDGRHVDVQLDASFTVVSSSADVGRSVEGTG